MKILIKISEMLFVYIAMLVILLSPFYVGVSAIEWNLNPIEWGKAWRAVIAVVFCFLTIKYIIYLVDNEW
jgi:hypothetical protein